MTFSRDLAVWTEKVRVRNQRIFAGVVAAVHESITVGSPITGAPGQPVGQYDDGTVGGNLRTSWQITFDSPTVAAITTKVPYAKSNEDGIARPGGGPYRLRSSVGGRHSVKLTRAGFPRLVDHVTREQGGT